MGFRCVLGSQWYLKGREGASSTRDLANEETRGGGGLKKLDLGVTSFKNDPLWKITFIKERRKFWLENSTKIWRQ